MTESRQVPPEFRAMFELEAGRGGSLSFDRFMALALYHPKVGYYRSARTRVGFDAGSDFFTASSSGQIFGELIAEACTTLLGSRPANEFTFVEIGSETASSVLAGVAHPFKALRTFQIGEPLVLSGPCIVFSNELLDAQPFRRFIGRNGRWTELGVTLRGDILQEVALPELPRDELLPADAPEGYIIDAPLASVNLMETIVRQPWTGLFVACDYGKTWRELTEACPGGTARAYYRHTQSNNLLAHPGEQDLTCHICWDWLVTALERHRFTALAVEFQESFLVRYAGNFIARTSAAEALRFSPVKKSLMQLLHPAHLGQKFQVLHGVRD